MTIYTLTKNQARRFMLLKHGLIGKYKFIGKNGVLEFVGQAGCIQFDPVDVCGKNAELVLQSRVKGFTKQMLYDLLYKDRSLFDYFDKNLAIMETSDWPYFEREREHYKNGGRSHYEVGVVSQEIKDIIRVKGPVSSSDIDFNESVDWYWNNTKLSRAALELMYFRGELAVHHKKGTIKYYDLAENCIPRQLLRTQEPHREEMEYLKWRVLRRIGGVGLLWNKASDAWLGIGLKARERNEIFAQLVNEDKLIALQVEGISNSLYCLRSDIVLLDEILEDNKIKDRCELIAPLDNLIWDRCLIKALYDFDYKWEIYTPEVQRKFGHYVLPVLYGDRFIGRVEALNDKKGKRLIVKKIWLEDGIKHTKKLGKSLDDCFKRFAKFNGCSVVVDRSKSDIGEIDD